MQSLKLVQLTNPLAAIIKALQSALILKTKRLLVLLTAKLKKDMLSSFVMKDLKADQACRKCLLLPHKSLVWDLALKLLLVTDGRFSGASRGISIGHVSPEAAEGGPIAFVQDGDHHRDGS